MPKQRQSNEATSVTGDMDALYQLPLGQFTAARNALAKKIGGSARAEIRALQKPSLVAWAVNQLYWQARPVFDHLLSTAGETREAQRAVLSGRTADLRAADARHREAVRAAFDRAAGIVSASDHSITSATRDALRRTLDALNGGGPFGRLTEALEPAGFEALAGLVPAGRPPVPAKKIARTTRVAPARVEPACDTRREQQIFDATKAVRDAEREAARAGAAANEVSGRVERLRAAEAEARRAWEHVREQLREAEITRAGERQTQATASRTLDTARKRLDELRRGRV